MLAFFAIAALTLSWLIPDHYPPWSSFYNESASALGLLLIALLVGRCWSTSRVTLASVWVLAVALIPMLQWAFGFLYYSGDMWVAVLYLFGFAVAISVGQMWAQVDAGQSAELL